MNQKNSRKIQTGKVRAKGGEIMLRWSAVGGKGEGFRRQGSQRLHALLSGGMWRADAPGSIPTLRRGQLVGERVVNVIKGFKEFKERMVLGKMGVALVGVVMAVVCVGCRERGLVDYALEEAGDNRSEIEGMLARYAGADEGRRELMVWQVEGMIGQAGMTGPGIDSIEALYRRLPRNGSWVLTEEEIEQWKRYGAMELRRMKDLETATGSYLMANIEDALRLRRERRWNEGLPDVLHVFLTSAVVRSDLMMFRDRLLAELNRRAGASLREIRFH